MSVFVCDCLIERAHKDILGALFGALPRPLRGLREAARPTGKHPARNWLAGRPAERGFGGLRRTRNNDKDFVANKQKSRRLRIARESSGSERASEREKTRPLDWRH